ncbi:hypothetical protein [Planococcus chinensis]|uniref:Uncharacterized protein n=1 Tax=Planococcus chinensis TaxID=272917 RepID=A0ABW4QFY5_9BACL
MVLREKRRQPFKFDRHKTDRRSGFFCRTAGLAYDPRTWLPESGQQKSGGSRSGSTGIRQTGEAASFAAQPGWLMTREPGCRSLDNRKAVAAVQVRQA